MSTPQVQAGILSPEGISQKLKSILPRVQKPGRYMGGELNAIVKLWESARIHVALAFPDIYDIGLPNLGLAILYDEINHRQDALAERAFLPWVDMEQAMRSARMPLYTLETKRPVSQFDILGITLPYESLYTNVLNLLDLSGLPLFSSQREGPYPLIIAGGHATYNPEPMAPFIDVFVIGEGEEIIHDIIDAYKSSAASAQGKADLLYDLAQIDGVYVPRFYHPIYDAGGNLKQVLREAGVPAKVQKRIISKLPAPVAKPLVPSIDVVHNRVAVEIMRGCTRGCRFCQAGMVMRPTRERPLEEVLQAIDSSLRATGYEEVALLSLSSSDYSHIRELVAALAQRYGGRKLTISLPSLRIESLSVELLDELQGSRQTSFTLAPEAATERMRRIINKPISTEDILNTAQAIYERGWLTIKLYFMIGHPAETLDDVQAIADLSKAVLQRGRAVHGKKARVHVGVSTFVPKPHTPFQWVACDSGDQINAKLALLQREITGPAFRLSWTDLHETFLEAWLSRGDRRVAEAIYLAWTKGAKFDAWGDQFRYEAWVEAFAGAGLDPFYFSHRTRALDELFPWDIVSSGVRKSWLAREYARSLAGDLTSDCREQCTACGILPGFAGLRRQTAPEDWKCPLVAPKRSQITALPAS